MSFPVTRKLALTDLSRRGVGPACILLVALLLTGGCGYIPSGALEGNPAPLPADWSAVASQDVIRFETRPSEPYSVELWVIGVGNALYVHAGDNRANWVEHIEADANVRLQAEDSVYELRAERVIDAAEFKAFADVYEEKYGWRPRNESVTEAYLFRLSPRA